MGTHSLRWLCTGPKAASPGHPLSLQSLLAQAPQLCQLQWEQHLLVEARPLNYLFLTPLLDSQLRHWLTVFNTEKNPKEYWFSFYVFVVDFFER